MGQPPHLRTQSELNRFECEECVAAVTHNLIGACASVGIEHGKSTDQMLLEWLTDYHRRGHVARPSTDTPVSQ